MLCTVFGLASDSNGNTGNLQPYAAFAGDLPAQNPLAAGDTQTHTFRWHLQLHSASPGEALERVESLWTELVDRDGRDGYVDDRLLGEVFPFSSAPSVFPPDRTGRYLVVHTESYGTPYIAASVRGNYATSPYRLAGGAQAFEVNARSHLHAEALLLLRSPAGRERLVERLYEAGLASHLTDAQLATLSDTDELARYGVPVIYRQPALSRRLQRLLT